MFRNKGFILILLLSLLLAGASCATTKRARIEDQRRGLLLLDGDRKNQGFYKPHKPYKKSRKGLKAHRRKNKRRRR